MSIGKEFKEFALKGNVIDLAVGIIIGAAFGKIVASFVADILMPPIGVIIGGINFTDLKYHITEKATWNYGNFIQAFVDFLIIAFAIFMFIKVMNSAKKKIDPPPAGPTKEEQLLTEIRDLLKK
jgi:large conductance mechanosensitive channel